MYAIVSDVEERLDAKHLVELADDDGDGVVDVSVVEAAIGDGDALIDTYLSGRYVLPFDPVPSLLKRLSCDLAIGALFGRRREAQSPLHEARAESAVRLLESLARGEVALAGTMVRPASASSTLGSERLFDRDSLSAY